MGYTLLMKIAGIPGEHGKAPHQGWIEVLSFSNGVARYDQQAAAAQQDFTIAKLCDRASPLLALACSEGWRIKDVALEMRRTEGDRPVFMEIRLSDVTVTSYCVSGGPQGDQAAPFENASFKYGKIEWRYFPSASGSEKETEAVRASWTSQEYREPAVTNPRSRDDGR